MIRFSTQRQPNGWTYSSHVESRSFEPELWVLKFMYVLKFDIFHEFSVKVGPRANHSPYPHFVKGQQWDVYRLCDYVYFVLNFLCRN